MKHVLTNSEIDAVASNKRLYPINFARAIEQAILAKIGDRIAYLSKDKRIIWDTTHPQYYTPLYAIPFIEGEE